MPTDQMKELDDMLNAPAASKPLTQYHPMDNDTKAAIEAEKLKKADADFYEAGHDEVFAAARSHPVFNGPSTLDNPPDAPPHRDALKRPKVMAPRPDVAQHNAAFEELENRLKVIEAEKGPMSPEAEAFRRHMNIARYVK